MKATLYYDHFVWEANIPFDCPLCHVHIPAGVRHECSNPKPEKPKPLECLKCGANIRLRKDGRIVRHKIPRTTTWERSPRPACPWSGRLPATGNPTEKKEA